MKMDSQTEIRIHKRQRRKNAANRAKKLNGLKCEDIELACMDWTKLHHLAGLKVVDSGKSLDIPNELLVCGLVSQADVLGRKPLWYAARAGNDVLIPVLVNGVEDSDVDAAFCIALVWHRVTSACAILQQRPTYEPSENTRQVLVVMLDTKWDVYKMILSFISDKVVVSRFLNHACWCGDDDIVKQALTLGLSINEHDHLDRTPLHNAAQQFHVSTVKLLLEAGADPCAVDSSGCTAAHYVCSSQGHSSSNSTNSRACLEAMVNKKPSVLNQKNNLGRTPLLEALYRGNEEFVVLITKKFLHHLDTSVRDNFGFSYSHYSPLRADELANGTEATETPEAKKLVLKGTPVKHVKKMVMRYIAKANKERPSPGFQMDDVWLIPFGFHSVTDIQEKTSVLHMCIKMKQIEVLDFLATSSNCSVRDDLGRTPLALAVDLRNVEAITCLLQHISPDPNEIELILRRCPTPDTSCSPRCPMMKKLVNCLDVAKLKEWLDEVKAPQEVQEVSDSKKAIFHKPNLLQYCFLWGSNELVASICDEIPLETLSKAPENRDLHTIAELSPIEIAALLCRQEIMSATFLEKVPDALKNKMLVLSASFDIYVKQKSSSPFITACLAPVEDDIITLIDTLIDSGAEVNSTVNTPYGSAIQGACFSGMEKAVAALISCGASTFTEIHSRTALEAALQHGHEDLFLKMMDLTSESDFDSGLAWKIMTLACSRKQWQAAYRMVHLLEQREYPEMVNFYKDAHNDTCLHYCAREGMDELLQKCLYLLTRAGHLTALTVLNKTGQSPLCCAVVGNNWRCAFVIIAHLSTNFPSKLLLRNEYYFFSISGGSNSEVKDDLYKRLVRRLLPLLVDLPPGANLLMKCCGTGDFEAVEELLEVNPEMVQTNDSQYRGPDFYSAINGRMDMVEYLEDFREKNGFDGPPPMIQGLVLLAILINKARHRLRNCSRRPWDLAPSRDDLVDEVKKHHIWELMHKVCLEHMDTVCSTVEKFIETEDGMEFLWNIVAGLSNVRLHISLHLLCLFTRVYDPLIENYYNVSSSEWVDYRVNLGISENMPYPDPLVVSLSGGVLTESDLSLIGSLIQTLAKDHCMLMTVSVDTLLKCEELTLLCDMFSVKSNVAHYDVKLHAAFLRACSVGHFALSAVTCAFLLNDKDIRILGLNLAVATGNQNVIHMLSKGICPCSTASSEYCSGLFDEFPKAWKRKVRPCWSPIFSAAASNNLPVLKSFLDLCEHVTDDMLAETAFVAASRGSYDILEYILMRQPRVLYIDTENLTLGKNWPDLAAVSLLACCVKSQKDSCSTLVLRHMLNQNYLSLSLVDVLPFACELGLVETVRSLLAIQDKVAFSESQLSLSKSSSLELGHLEVFEAFDEPSQQLLLDRDYKLGFAKCVREMCESHGVDIPLPLTSTCIINNFLKRDEETTVFHILHRVEELELLSMFTVNAVIGLLKTAVQSQCFGVLEPLLSILDHITTESEVNQVVYDTVCLAIRLQRAESLRSIFLHRNNSDLQVAAKPHMLHVAAIYGNMEIGKVLLEFFEAKDLEVTFNDLTPHQVAVTFGNREMAQILNPLAVNFH